MIKQTSLPWITVQCEYEKVQETFDSNDFKEDSDYYASSSKPGFYTLFEMRTTLHIKIKRRQKYHI